MTDKETIQIAIAEFTSIEDTLDKLKQRCYRARVRLSCLLEGVDGTAPKGAKKITPAQKAKIVNTLHRKFKRA